MKRAARSTSTPTGIRSSGVPDETSATTPQRSSRAATRRPSARSGVTRAQVCGPSGRLQRLAHHQGDGGGGVLLGAGGHHATGLPGPGRSGRRTPASAASRAAARFQLRQSAVASAGRRASLISRWRAQAARLDGRLDRRPEPGPHVLALDLGAFQQPLQRALRMLFLDRVPGRGVEIEVEAGQDDAALRRARPRRLSTSAAALTVPVEPAAITGPCGGCSVPALGQQAQQPWRAARRGSTSPMRRQPLGPGLDRQAEEVGRRAASARRSRPRPGWRPARRSSTSSMLAGIEEAAEGVGQLQRAHRRQVRREILDDHPRHLEPARQGGDGGRQVEAQFAGRERRLVLLQIAERPHLRQQHGAVAAQLRQGGGEGARRAAVGQQDGRVGQGLRRLVAQPVEHARGQVLEEGPVRGDGEPARALPSPAKGSKRSRSCGRLRRQPRLGLVARLRVADVHPVAVQDAAVQPPRGGRGAPQAGSARRGRRGRRRHSRARVMWTPI